MHRFHFSRHHREAHAPEDHGFGFGRGRHGRHGMDRHGLGGRSGRRERVFEQGDLRFVLLQLIAEKPSHGYELIKAIEDRLGGAYSPSPGVIYPTLTLLEELGYVIVVQSEGAKKAYEITDEGRAALTVNKASVDAIFKRIHDVAERSGGRPAPQIVRAMENLRLALALRLERGKLSDEQVADIAAALDAAALTVERE
jgi:DNA-binding PadR family transcriptional regulator